MIGIDGRLAFTYSAQDGGFLFHNLISQMQLGPVRGGQRRSSGHARLTHTGDIRRENRVFLVSNNDAISMPFVATSWRKSSVRSKRAIELGSIDLMRSVRTSTLNARMKFATNVAVSTLFPPP